MHNLHTDVILTLKYLVARYHKSTRWVNLLLTFRANISGVDARKKDGERPGFSPSQPALFTARTTPHGGSDEVRGETDDLNCSSSMVEYSRVDCLNLEIQSFICEHCRRARRAAFSFEQE